MCYHCQQVAEKILKVLILVYDGEVQKMPNLGLPVDELSELVTFSEEI